MLRVYKVPKCYEEHFDFFVSSTCSALQSVLNLRSWIKEPENPEGYAGTSVTEHDPITPVRGDFEIVRKH